MARPLARVGIEYLEQENEQGDVQMTTRLPAHQLAYAGLRDMVLFGELAPGTAVTIEGLVARLSLGMTPVREAIRRLIAEGALVMQGNRRVSVPRLSVAALEELHFARAAVEGELARRAMARAPFAQLQAVDLRVDAAIAAEDIPAYLRENHGFHFALYRAAQAGVLEALAASLWLRFGPSLRVVCLGQAAGNTVDHHKAMLAALAVQDAAALATALEADIAQGVANIRAGLAAGLYG